MTNMMDAKALAESSARWMQAGLEAFTQQTHIHDFAVHHCAIAVEHLLKAYLTSLHPALIVDAKDLDSLLHATGHGAHAKGPVTRMKTIGLAEALDRAVRFLRPQITVAQTERDQMLVARNGVAHSGLHDPTKVESVLATCIRIVDVLINILDVPKQDFWGRYHSLHDRLVEKRANSLQIRYESKLIHARHTYQRRFDGMELTKRTAILVALGAERYDPERESPRKCPACSEKGRLVGVTSEVQDVDEADGRMVFFFSEAFGCTICGLSLRGVEELDLASLPVKIPLYSPDEDKDDQYQPRDDDFGTFYMPKPEEYDDYEPGDYEAEDDPNDPDFSNREPDGDAWRPR